MRRFYLTPRSNVGHVPTPVCSYHISTVDSYSSQHNRIIDKRERSIVHSHHCATQTLATVMTITRILNIFYVGMGKSKNVSPQTNKW